MNRRRRISAFLAGRIVESFQCGMGMKDLGRRFHISLDRIEATIRRHANRRRTR